MRWFIEYDIGKAVPHFTTFGKNYTRRFAGSDVLERIFARILQEAADCGFVDAKAVFAEDYRYTPEYKEIYERRKETIERVFADAKEKHGIRYTRLRELQKVRMQITLTFACMNLKKLAKWKRKRLPKTALSCFLHSVFSILYSKSTPCFA
ncbi:MAG: transposase [Oscillospiraceae bacterium]